MSYLELLARATEQYSAQCYACNNRYAYYADKYDVDKDESSFLLRDGELKVHNFVPTYDKWCLYCNKKGVKAHCGRCKTVYFCDRSCQEKAWYIHRRHCGRDQFVLCAHCGTHLSDQSSGGVKCDRCPVRFCSVQCMVLILAAHKEFDCETFATLFAVKSS